VIASGDDGWDANSYVKQSGVVTKGYADNVILLQFLVILSPLADILPVQKVILQLLFSNLVRCFAV